MDQTTIQDEILTKAQEKKKRVDQAVRRRKQKQFLWGIIILLVGIMLIGGSVSYSRWRTKNLPGEPYAELGREHIPLEQEPPKPYNSNPPSSGAHFYSPANWRMYDYEVPDKLFIHNLEHGGIWFSYKPDVPKEVVDQLKTIVEEFGVSKIVMAPRLANDTDIAIVAWTRVMKLNIKGDLLMDEQKNLIKRFYKAFKNHGPEFVPDTMPGVDPKDLLKKIE